MPQIFILGSSNVYGVGGENGGWADLVKQKLHKKMFTPSGIGERYEIYNFGKSGAQIDFVTHTFPQQLEQYGRRKKIIAIVSVGGNNIKAENEPDNYISTLEEYIKDMTTLLDLLKRICSQVIVVGSSPYDETKTNPIEGNLVSGKAYFSNQRRQLFEAQLIRLCKERGLPFVSIDIPEEKWKEKYIYKDGLHPGLLGHDYISDKVLEELTKIL